MKYNFLFLLILSFFNVSFIEAQTTPAHNTDSTYTQSDSIIIRTDSLSFIPQKQICPQPYNTATDSLSILPKKKKHFWRAAAETVGLNIGLWAFDRYVLDGHYARISFETIKENFKHGFDWDNDHLSTNMFAHPYHGSMYFNTGRANGFNYWQSELFAIGGSAMWELFMESEYPSTNDIIATPVGGAALGEVFYRVSDMMLDDRSSGGERFGREFAAFLISPMRGLNRIITGQAWKKGKTTGRDFGNPNLKFDVSLGTRLLAFHNQDNITKFGGAARFEIEYGDKFNTETNRPYDYFSFLLELNAMKTQPLLSQVEIIGRLYSKNLIEKNNMNLSVGAFQHFDFFDSDTIQTEYNKQYDWDPCEVPYKLGTPASLGIGAMFKYQNPRCKFNAYTHFNGIILGGILSDFYRYYNRNYNWASGFSLKFGLNCSLFNDKIFLILRSHTYWLYTYSQYDFDTDWSETPNGKPVDVKGDDSSAIFFHLESMIDYRIWKQLYFSAGVDFYHRFTTYEGKKTYEMDGMNFTLYDILVDSNQVSLEFMLKYKF